MDGRADSRGTDETVFDDSVGEDEGELELELLDLFELASLLLIILNI